MEFYNSGFLHACSMSYFRVQEGEGEPCPHCNNWFTTKSVLSLHMRDAHNDRLLTKKEVEVTMNRMRRQLEEQKKVLNIYADKKNRILTKSTKPCTPRRSPPP